MYFRARAAGREGMKPHTFRAVEVGHPAVTRSLAALSGVRVSLFNTRTDAAARRAAQTYLDTNPDSFKL
jgi:hypothetical protein